MSQRFFRDESRKNYAIDVPDDAGVSRDALECGALLRIADATEAMARNYNALLAERDSLKSSLEHWRGYARKTERKVAALRGVITKMKRASELRGRR